MTDLTPPRGISIIAGSYLAALVLTIWPLPHWAELFRPAWVVMVTVYWCLWLPQRVGVITAFAAGLLLDALTGTLLGEHALALVLVAWSALWMHLQVRVYPWWQQSVVVLCIMLVYSFVLFWVDGILGYTLGAGLRWTPVVLTALVWPWVTLVLARLQHRYHVS
ncbi:MAG: rod shape-determining protein MreD [Bacillota bacterium]